MTCCRPAADHHEGFEERENLLTNGRVESENSEQNSEEGVVGPEAFREFDDYLHAVFEQSNVKFTPKLCTQADRNWAVFLCSCIGLVTNGPLMNLAPLDPVLIRLKVLGGDRDQLRRLTIATHMQ
jgi:hypothetical protein